MNVQDYSTTCPLFSAVQIQASRTTHSDASGSNRETGRQPCRPAACPCARATVQVYLLTRPWQYKGSQPCPLTHSLLARSLAGFVSPITGLSAYATCFTVSLTLRPVRPPRTFVVCDALAAYGVLYIGTRQDRVDISIFVVWLNQAYLTSPMPTVTKCFVISTYSYCVQCNAWRSALYAYTRAQQ